MTRAPRHPDLPILLVRTTRDVPGYTVTQPLGILYLGAVLREHGYRNVRLIDMRPDRMETAQVMEEVRRFRPRLLGLSSLSYEAEKVTEIVEATRRLDPSIHIALGGPFPSSMKEKTFDLAPADSVCVGGASGSSCAWPTAWRPGSAARGGEGIVQACSSAVARPRPPRDLSYRRSGHAAAPAWDMLDLRSTSGSRTSTTSCQNPKYMSVMTTRGCPYRCAYCHNVHGKTFRKRSVDHVMREIRALVRDHGFPRSTSSTTRSTSI